MKTETSVEGIVTIPKIISAEILKLAEPPETSMDKLIQSLKVNPLEILPEPPVILWYQTEDGRRSPLISLGNFSLIIGKAKSRKTFLLTSIVSAAITGASNLKRLSGDLPVGGKVVLIDTEQSQYHLSRTVNRICRQSKVDNPSNLDVYGLRPFSPRERLDIIDRIIRTTDRMTFLLIDGVRDLLSYGINNEEEATELTSKILKWSYEKNIHILLVLHQNKGDNNARGHIGTELVNKSETVLSVAKDTKNKNVSIVTPEFTRDIDFEPFQFYINEDGLPELDLNSRPVSSKSVQIRENFIRLLRNKSSVPYTDLCKEYMELEGVSERTAKGHISQAIKEVILFKEDNGRYTLHAESDDDNDSE